MKRKQVAIELAKRVQLLRDNSHAQAAIRSDWRRFLDSGVIPFVRDCPPCRAVFHDEPVPSGFRLVNPLPWETFKGWETAA